MHQSVCAHVRRSIPDGGSFRLFSTFLFDFWIIGVWSPSSIRINIDLFMIYLYIHINYRKSHGYLDSCTQLQSDFISKLEKRWNREVDTRYLPSIMAIHATRRQALKRYSKPRIPIKNKLRNMLCRSDGQIEH